MLFMRAGPDTYRIDKTSPGTIATAALLLAMSLVPTATALAAVPPMAALMTGMYLFIPLYLFEF